MTKEVLKLALEALTRWAPPFYAGKDARMAEKAITAIKEALAAPVQDDYKAWYEEAMVASNEAGFVGLSAAETIRDLNRMVFTPPAQPATVQEPVAIDGNTSDGYHTFNELYEFRKAYNAALFNEWAANGKCSVHKSWRHHDGELCFGGGWFIVVAILPNGQISNHYEAKDWDLFDVQEIESALFEFDGHTGLSLIHI